VNKAVFLDRDGVLNASIVRDGKPYPPSDASEVVLVPGVVEAAHAFRAAGFLLLVATNQPDVATGVTTREAVDAINAHLGRLVPIDRFYVCYHQDGDGCDCRKPRPGLLLQGAREFDLALDRCYMIGDRWRDVGAGRAAGCKTVFLDYGYREEQPADPDFRVLTMAAASAAILNDALAAGVRP
jgi:D-glycero-D-manno-heptose 1,7-bisphosphate phosphatase